MTRVLERGRQIVHVRFEGRSLQYQARALDVDTLTSDDSEVKLALARRLEIPVGRLTAYVVERHDNGNLTIRPEAVFG
jgi:hypothetical protein